VKSKLLSSGGLMDLVINALDRKIPFSVVSVGVTESFVLAQYSVLTEEEFLGHKETRVAAQGVKRGFDHRGIRFPNIQARDKAVASLRSAEVIGYNTTEAMHSDQLTKKVFDYYKIEPRFIFEANIRRVIMFSQQEKFEKMLTGRKIVLICSYADEVKAAMEKNMQNRLGFKVTGTIKIEEFEDIPRVKAELTRIDFDLCLLAAGINAVILAPYIATTYGKVAFDLGQAMESFISGDIEMAGYLDRYIGIDNLMKM
jgi:hypothetical protein